MDIFFKEVTICVKLAPQILKKLIFYSLFNFSSFAYVCTFRMFICTLLVKKLIKKKTILGGNFTNTDDLCVDHLRTLLNTNVL